VALRYGFSWTLLAATLAAGITLPYVVARFAWRCIEQPCSRLKERVAG
jgi:hypothetical protein